MKKRLAVWGAVAALGVGLLLAGQARRERGRATKVNPENCERINRAIQGPGLDESGVESILGLPGEVCEDSPFLRNPESPNRVMVWSGWDEGDCTRIYVEFVDGQATQAIQVW